MIDIETFDKAAALARVPGFAEVGAEALAELATLFEAQAFAPGAYICEEGDVADTIFVLAEGEAEVVKLGNNTKRYAVSTLSAGVLFGHVGVMVVSRRTASVRARVPCVVLSLSTKTARQLVQADDVRVGSPIRRALIVAMGRQLWSATSTTMSLAVDAGVAEVVQRAGIDGEEVGRRLLRARSGM